MRKITEEATKAFLSGTPYSNSNTKVMGDKDATIMTLHGHMIASREGNKVLLSSAGWLTNTTKERLNGVLSSMGSEWRIYQLKGVWYITDGMGAREEWAGIKEFKI